MEPIAKSEDLDTWCENQLRWLNMERDAEIAEKTQMRNDKGISVRHESSSFSPVSVTLCMHLSYVMLPIVVVSAMCEPAFVLPRQF